MQTKTKAACAIIGMTQSRLNEIIHLGHYPCIPETKAGAARVFSVDDVAVLWGYKILTDSGLTSSVAGKICCQIRETIRPDTISAHVYLKRGGDTLVELSDGKVAQYDLDDHSITPSFHAMHTPVSIVLNIEELRVAVSRSMDGANRLHSDN